MTKPKKKLPVVKTTQLSRIASPESLTSSSINYIVSGMRDGDKLEITPGVGGKVTLTVSSSGQQTSRISHRIGFVLEPLPVSQSWMPNSLEDDDSGRGKLVVAKKASAKKQLKSVTGLKTVLKQAFEMALAFMTLEDALEIQESALSTYLKFKVGEYFVYTKLDMHPVMYTESNGELVYL
jgi:hypothetical protein